VGRYYAVFRITLCEFRASAVLAPPPKVLRKNTFCLIHLKDEMDLGL
jgi:hypothetical protein